MATTNLPSVRSSRSRTITPADVSQLPVLDPDVLTTLGAELASRTGALQFAGTFVALIPQRVGAVEAAVEAGDTDAAVVALLSLNVGSSMVGARRLEQASSMALESAGRGSAHMSQIAQLHTLGVELQSALGGIIR